MTIPASGPSGLIAFMVSYSKLRSLMRYVISAIAGGSEFPAVDFDTIPYFPAVSSLICFTSPNFSPPGDSVPMINGDVQFYTAAVSNCMSSDR
ncbi:Hypothetical protein NTJ_08422 [Nesidiocoris tenuis]|uniref:Uncharacterized protein n=1 Tax=Nesidiocoris tenuis TaxID=355587 RepID=A0ABN7AUA4_9HEMI|nr:Hypothetical protein NTJ_08422 [Nesidiocoris tenuis]